MPLLAAYPFWDVFWTIAVFFVWLIWIYLVIMALVDLFGRVDIGAWTKVAWFVFICLIPFLGVLGYIVVRPPDRPLRAA